MKKEVSSFEAAEIRPYLDDSAFAAIVGDAMPLTAEEKDLLAAFSAAVSERNRVMNLTAITDRDEFARLHLMDSLSVLSVMHKLGISRGEAVPAEPAYVDGNAETISAGTMQLPPKTKRFNALDLGSGAGFPGIPLAICYPGIRWLLVDSLDKRIRFLREYAEKLGLSNVEAIHERAEQMGRSAEHRAHYDLVTARAVASLPVLCEYAIPLLKNGGFLLAMKGPQAGEELKQAEAALRQLGAELFSLNPLHLGTANAEQRNIVVIRKCKETPARYPRASAQIRQKPL